MTSHQIRAISCSVMAALPALILWSASLSAAPPPPEGAAKGASKEANVETERIPLNAGRTVVLDRQNKELRISGEVVMRTGLLEMFACLKHTKEHESIVAVDSKAYVVHAGLLALGLEPGRPVQFVPEFQPPQGPRLRIDVEWTGEDGKLHRVDARRWVRHSTQRYFAAPLSKLPVGLELPEGRDLIHDPREEELLWYGVMSEDQKRDSLALSGDAEFRKAVETLFQSSQIRPMTAEWVFAGSRLFQDTAGRQLYEAESGDLICVANFGSATIDVAIASGAGNESLTFEAATERIPPKGTPVTILISAVPVAQAPVEQAPSTTQPVDK